MNSPHKFLKAAAIFAALISISSCSFIPAEVIIRPGVQGVKKIPVANDDTQLKKTRNIILLPDGSLVSTRFDTHKGVSGCGDNIYIDKFDTELKNIWSVPLVLNCWQEKFLGVIANSETVSVFVLKGVMNENDPNVMTTYNQVKILQFSTKTGATIADSIFFKQENDLKAEYKSLHTDSTLVIYYYFPELLTDSSGRANVITLNNKAEITASVEIPYANKTLPLKTDKEGNIYSVRIYIPAVDTLFQGKVEVYAQKTFAGSGLIKKLNHTIPLRELKQKNSSSYNTKMGFYTYSVTPEGNISFIAQSRHKEGIAGYTGVVFDFTDSRAFKTIDFAPYNREMNIEKQYIPDFLKLHNVTDIYHLEKGRTIMLLENIEMYVYRDTRKLGQYGGYEHWVSYPYEGYGTIRAISFDESGKILWESTIPRKYTEPTLQNAGSRETTAQSLTYGNTIAVYYRDRNIRNGIAGHTINTETGETVELDMPVILENHGNGVVLERTHSLLLPNGKAILFTKNSEAETYGDILELNFKEIPVLAK